MENTTIKNPKYSYMKSIRFNLIDTDNKLSDLKSNSNQDSIINLDNIFSSYDKLIKEFKSLFFEVDKNKDYKRNNSENYILKRTIKIKKQWFKTYFKEGWNFKEEKKQEIEKTQTKINETVSKFENLCKQLRTDIDHDKNRAHKKHRNSNFSSILQQIKNKDVFYLLNDLVKQSINKNEVSKVNSLIKDFSSFEKKLNQLSKEYLASQSLGIELYRSSFNYYTLNKSSKHYLKQIEKKIQNYKDEKNKTHIEFQNNSIKVNDMKLQLTSKDLEVMENIKSELKIKFPLNLEESKYFMKLFKAKLKSDLFKDCQKNNEIKDYSCLFNENKKLKKIFDLTREIQNENEFKEIQNLKKDRGEILKSFENWKNFINSYRKISQDYGRIKTNIANYEKEKIDSQKLRYWNLFLKKDNQIYILFVPIEFRQDVKEKITNANTVNSPNKIFMIKSLTKRALHKLCFNEYGSFLNEMKKKKKETYNEIIKFKQKFREEFEQNKIEKLNQELIQELKKKKIKFENDELKRSKNFVGFMKNFENKKYGQFKKQFKEKIEKLNQKYTKQKEEKTTKILKEVLQSDYAKSRLDLKDFDLQKVYLAQTSNEFEEELEKECYKILPYYIDNKLLSELETLFKVFKCKIQSYDLDKRFKNETQTPKSLEKRHTREYWNEFWQKLNQSKIRLNPEIRVNYKEKDNEMERYLWKRYNVDKEKIKENKYGFNRNLQDKYIINFSFLVNTGKKFLDLGFADSNEIKHEIEDFNIDLNKKMKNPFFCGIDIGEVELASSAIYAFDDKHKYQFNNQKFIRPVIPDNLPIKCLRLKKEYYTKSRKPSKQKVNFKKIEERQIISNLSYFSDQEELFDEISPFALNLTCSKVINGVIIENADILTYLQYMKKLAKRRLFEIYSKGFLETDNKKHNFQDLKLDWQYPKESNKYKSNNLILCDKENKIVKAKIFTFIYEYEGIKTKNGEYEFDSMKDYFNKYLNKLKKIKKSNDNKIIKEDIPRINNLRDALVSNMIGVLNLFNKFVDLYVVLENIPNKNKQDEYLIKRLESALFQKFQTFGMVPPNVKNLIKIKKMLQTKEDKDSGKEIQIGNILFINERKTSQTCPYCENSDNNQDHEKGIFLCSKCNFSTNDKEKIHLTELKILKSCDIVAAYNIAKKGYQFIINGTKHKNIKSE